MPFDTFVKWQIAGDEFEPDNPLALTATGFLGCGTHATQITQNQVEKERYDELDDIVRTTGTTMLGLTIGCARCHDHKYDPIPTRDYYRMMSTFTTTVRSDMDIDFNPEATKAAREAFDAEQAKLVEARTKYETDQLPAKFDQWLSPAGERKRAETPYAGPSSTWRRNRRAAPTSRSWPTAPCWPAARTLTSTCILSRRRRRSRESRPCGWRRWPTRRW